MLYKLFLAALFIVKGNNRLWFIVRLCSIAAGVIGRTEASASPLVGGRNVGDVTQHFDCYRMLPEVIQQDGIPAGVTIIVNDGFAAADPKSCGYYTSRGRAHTVAGSQTAYMQVRYTVTQIRRFDSQSVIGTGVGSLAVTVGITVTGRCRITVGLVAVNVGCVYTDNSSHKIGVV
jgi:hypothetical protein